VHVGPPRHGNRPAMLNDQVEQVLVDAIDVAGAGHGNQHVTTHDRVSAGARWFPAVPERSGLPLWADAGLTAQREPCWCLTPPGPRSPPRQRRNHLPEPRSLAITSITSMTGRLPRCSQHESPSESGGPSRRSGAEVCPLPTRIVLSYLTLWVQRSSSASWRDPLAWRQRTTASGAGAVTGAGRGNSHEPP
jgi:hypothetical protein